MKTLKYLLLIFFSAFSNKINAQIDTAWTRTWDSQYWDEAHAVITDDSNNIYVAGWSYEWTTNEDFIFLKYDANGNLLWSKIRNYASGDQASHIAIGPDGYLYIAGFVYGSYSTTGGYMTLMKYTLNGDSIWEFIDNNFSLTQISEMAFDNSGNIILAGFIGGTLGSADYLTMKIDSNGNQLWYQTFNNYGPNQSNRIYGMCVDAFDNIYVTGSCDDSTFHSNVVTIKYNQNGDSLWLRYFNAPSNDYDLGEKILTDPNGDLIIGGRINTTGPAQTDYMLLKYDTSGNLLWDKYFNYQGPQSFDIFHDMKINNSGNIYLVGSSSTNNAQNTIRVETIKFDQNGDTIWTARWGTGSDYQPQKMVMDDFENIYIAGYYYDNLNNTGYNAFAIKYDSAGVLKWETIYSDSSNQEEEFNSLCLDANNDLIAVGRTHAPSTFDFITVKYQNAISGLQLTEGGPEGLQIKCYPNPFSNATNINYYLPSTAEASLKIFNLTGNVVKVIVDGKQQAGNHIIQFNADGISSGIYLCRIESGSNSAQTKLIIVK